MIPWLSYDDPFPPVSQALDAASGAPGLLAASTALSAHQLLRAYRSSIFPWYCDDQPVLWWSPDPRMVLYPAEFKVSPSLRKTLRRVLRDPRWEIRVDDDFVAVMRCCAAAVRVAQHGTWITEEIVSAYGALHRAGLAHSVETWYDGTRVSGLYGVALGRMFFGESMFTERTDASKVALATLIGYLRQAGVEMIDCQQNTPHLASLGGREIRRYAFVDHVARVTAEPAPDWRFDKTALQDVIGTALAIYRDTP